MGASGLVEYVMSAVQMHAFSIRDLRPRLCAILSSALRVILGKSIAVSGAEPDAKPGAPAILLGRDHRAHQFAEAVFGRAGIVGYSRRCRRRFRVRRNAQRPPEFELEGWAAGLDNRARSWFQEGSG